MIPEVRSLAAPTSLVRIPPELDVPVSARVTRILDSPTLRRLGRVSQLGLVSLVYPGAIHTRLEHTLGVYRNALLVLNHLASDQRFGEMVTPRDAEAFVVAALLHDAGHWPFCHPIEDMRLPEVPRHEARVRELIAGPELAPLLATDWSCAPEQIVRILEKCPESPAEQLLASMLSGPLDIDKLDYLVRDSLHAGVPYGRNFDSGRLISALCVHPQEPKLALGEKGKTAAEMMVFARYVMFSEVYWHHAVRSATAMLQRAVFMLRERLDLNAMNAFYDAGWIAALRRSASGTAAEPLVDGLFGVRRQLLKRVAQFNVLDEPQMHARLAHRPYAELADVSQALAEKLSTHVGLPLGLADVIIDAPPVKLEVDINIDVVFSDGAARPLGAVSPVVDALARRQFDSHVKRVRVFTRKDVRDQLPQGRIPPADLDALQTPQKN